MKSLLTTKLHHASGRKESGTIVTEQMSRLYNPIDIKKNHFVFHFFIAVCFLLFSVTSNGQGTAQVTASGPLTFCQGNTLVLTATNINPSATLQWTKNGSPISGSVSDTLKVTQSGTYNVEVTQLGSTTTLNDVVVTVNPKPNLRLNGTGATTIKGQPYFKVCASSAQSFTFTNSSSTAFLNTRYVIRWGDGTPDYNATSFTTPITHTYPVGVRQMTYIVYTANCVDSMVYNVFVGNIPAGGLVGVGGSTICSGEEQKFVIAGTENNPIGTMYILYYNDGSKRDTFFHPAPDTVSHTFDSSSCGYTSSNGIQSFSNSYGAFLTITNPCGVAGGSILPIYVSDKPKVEFIFNPGDTVCVNTPVNITNTRPFSRNVENGTCTPIKYIWRVRSLTPGGTWTITSGTLGQDFGSNDPNIWLTGSQIVGVRFTKTGTYSVKLVMINNTLCGADSLEKIICVNPVPDASFSIDRTTGCAPLTVSASGTTNTPVCGTNRFNWTIVYTPITGCTPNTASYEFVNGTSLSSSAPQLEFRNPGTYKLILQTFAPGNFCSSALIEKEIIVKGKPVVQLQAPSDICKNATINPTAQVSCYTDAATYNWNFESGSPASSVSAIPGSVSYSVAGTYSINLDVTNECGTTAVVQPITVKPVPDVNRPSNITVCSGASVASIQFTGSLANTVFNWTNSQPSIGLAATGTGTINTFNAVNNGSVPVTATITVTPALNGCGAGASQTFTITVNPLPSAPGVSNLQLCREAPSNALTATASNGHTLIWYETASGSATYPQAPVPSTNTVGTTTYYVSQKSDATSCESIRSSIVVTILPKADLSDSVITICSGEVFSFVPVGAPSGTKYNWSAPQVSGGLTGGGAGSLKSLVDGNLTNTTSSVQTATYTVTPVTGSCSGATFQLKVLVQPKPVITAKSRAICSGETFTVAPVDGQSSDLVPVVTTYTWSNPVVTPSGAVTGVLAQPNPQAEISQMLLNITNAPATVTYTVTPRSLINGTVCTGLPFTVSVTVNPKPLIPSQTVTICSRSSFNVTPTNNLPNTNVPSGTRYTWTEPVVTPAGAVTGSSEQLNPQTSISQALTNATASTAIVTYTVTPISADGSGCVGDPFLINVFVNPQPGIVDQETTICSGEIFSVVPAGTPVNTTYTWGMPVSDPVGAITGGTAQSIPQIAISQRLTNTTNKPATMIYTVLPALGTSCANAGFLVKVTVNPKPVIPDQSVTVCSNEVINVVPSAQQTGTIIPANTTYSWGTPVISPSGAVTGFSAEANPQPALIQTLTNLTNAPAIVTYTVTPYSGENGNCVGTPFKVAVTVNPDAKAILNFNTNYGCQPYALQMVNGSPASASSAFNWYVNDNFIGTGSPFPGYTIAATNDSVTVKMVALSKFGCKQDSVVQKFYTRPQPQAIFTKNRDTICGPASITITNTSPFYTGMNYRWDFGDGQTSTQYQPGSVVFQPAVSFGDTSYTIKLSVFNACDTVEYTQKIVVRSKPNAAFTSNRSFGCSPLKVVFTNTSSGLGNTYVWDFGDQVQVPATAKDTISHIYSTGSIGTFNVRLIANNHCGYDTAVFPLIVRPNQIRLDFDIDGNQKRGCASHTIRIINKSTGATSYKWDMGDGTILFTTPANDTLNYTYTTPGVYPVYLFASNGCSDTSAFISDIEVFGKPSAAFTADKYNACIGDSIQFSNQSVNASSYLWNFGNNATSATISPKYAYVGPGTYQVALVAYKNYGQGVVCVDTIKRPVVINDTLPLAFGVSAATGNCTPFKVTFKNTFKPYAFLQWDFGDGVQSSGDSVVHTYTRNGSYTVRLTIRSAGGCVYTGTRIITVAAPEGTVNIPSGFQCLENKIRFEATAFNTDSIVWNFGDGTVLKTTDRVVYHQYTAPGLYVPKISFLSASGCLFPVPDKDTIRIEAVLAGFRSVQQNYCGYTDVLFYDTSKLTYGGALVKWNFGDGQSGVGASITHRYASAGVYPIQMIVTGIAGCADTIQRLLPVTVHSIPDAAIEGSVNACTVLPSVYNANVNATDSISFYRWILSNGVSANTSSFVYPFNTPGTYELTLIAGTKFGCYDTVKNTIYVQQSPSVSVSQDATLCKGKSIVLNANGAVSYTWYPVEGLSCTTCSSVLASPATSTPYVVKGIGANGCPGYDTVRLTVIQPLKLEVSKSDSICIGSSIQLSASGATSYRWSPATGLSGTMISNPIATPVVTTKYRVVGFDANSCFTDTAYITVGVGKKPTLSLGPDQVLATGTPFALNPVYTEGPMRTWKWTPETDLSCADCSNPIATIKNDISYKVQATTVFGCTVSDTINIKVFCTNAQVFIANAFTPDGDGINDVLMVQSRGIKAVKYFRIFNRWGELIFEKYNVQPNDPSYGWDGKVRGIASAPAVFVYTAEVVCENGSSYTYKGNVSLIR